MKESTKFWLSCTPFLLIGLAVVLSPLFNDLMARRQEAAWRSEPLTMQIKVGEPTEAGSPHRTQTGGNRLVFEIGLLRLVMPAKGASGGSSSSGSRIATTHKASAGGSSGSSRNHKHSHQDIPYGSQHEFTGPGYHFSFDIRQGCLCLEDQRICIVDTPKLVIMAADGRVQSVAELFVPYPPLNGASAKVAAFIALAQKYAKVPPAEFAEEEWRYAPLTRPLEVKSATEASSGWLRETDAKGLVFETAHLRLVIPAIHNSNRRGAINWTTGSAAIATIKPLDEVARGIKRRVVLPGEVSQRENNSWRMGCSTRHTILGPDQEYNFDIIQGCLCISGQRVSIVDTPKLVILNLDGSIKSVRDLTVAYPPPSGQPEHIQTLLRSARNFAERFQPQQP